MKLNRNGSTLAVVFICTVVILVIVGSLMSVINTQRKIALKKEVMLQAYEAAETSVDYAYSYIINDINSHTVAAASSIPSAGYRSFPFTEKPGQFLSDTAPKNHSGKHSAMTLSDPDVRVLPAGPKDHFYIDGKVSPGDPNKDQYVAEQLIPVVSRMTATQGPQKFTAFVQKSISSREIGLFQYAIFFQGQLHLHRGFSLMGGVHANGNLFLNAHDNDDALYNGAITSAHHIYRGSTFDKGGRGSDAFGYVATTTEESGGWADLTTTPKFAPVVTGAGGAIKICNSDTSVPIVYGNLDCTMANWKKDATTLFGDNLKDKAMESPLLAPVGTTGYSEDSPATTDVNEFNNAPYTLLEPTLPVSNPNHQSTLMNNFEAKASLLFIVEMNSQDTITLHKLDGTSVVLDCTGDLNPLTNPKADLTQYSDVWRLFVVKGYKVRPEWDRSLGTDIHERDASNKFVYLSPVTLPSQDYHVIGRASADCTRIIAGRDFLFEDFDVKLSGAAVDAHTLFDLTEVPIAKLVTNAAQKNLLDTGAGQEVTIISGLFDSRLGRGIAPITIDIDALKKAMEAPLSSFTPANTGNPDYQFRLDFDPTATLTVGSVTKPQWNGLIYIEFPTSLTLQNTTANASAPAALLNKLNAKTTRQFAFSTVAEIRHPDRWDVTDNFGRKDRTDKIVPLAPELRRYPPANVAKLNSTILDAQYVLPAVQIINGGVLPHPNPSKGAEEGFSIATNAPVYLVGNYNCDGDCNTGTNFTGTTPTSFAVADSDQEIPAAFFCDTFTTLSNGWGTTPAGFTKSNRENSFYGANDGASSGNGSITGDQGTVGNPPGRPSRPRLADATTKYSQGAYKDFIYPASGEYVEISACVGTGEYPIFEFFNHAVESFAKLYNKMDKSHPNPIVYKGSVVALFHSEVQHIKQAYGRDVNKDIQVYYRQHGMSAICAVRFHQFLVDGNFPPGTPMLYVTQQKDYRLLRWSDADDTKILTAAGFTP